MAIRTSEDGRIRMAETVAGISGASSLNDARISTINKEDFSTEPTLRGWLIGDNWQWNGGNENIETV